MNAPKFLCFIISAILINFSSTSAQTNDFVYNFCGNTGNFTVNSAYSRNLNTLLSSLSSNITQTNGFKSASIGQNPDRVYGLFLCRGDVSIQFCQTCVAAARTAALQRCPNQKESILYYEKCMLRYSNQSILGALQTSPALFLTNPQNVSDRLDVFNRNLGNLFVGLGREASRVSNGPKFSTGSVNFTSFQTIYGLMQCSTDLTQSDCFRCLEGAMAYLPSCCDGKIGARVILPSCNLRYEVSSFFDSPFQDPTKKYLYHHCGETGNFIDSSVFKGLSLLPTKENFWIIRFMGWFSARVIYLHQIAPFVCCLWLVNFQLAVKGQQAEIQKAKKAGAPVGTRFKSSTSHEFQNGPEVNCFSLTSILAATDCFSAVNKLGEGGFGPVYQGTLLDGLEIAVKRLSKNSGQGLEEFMNEVTVIAKLQHKNLVRLLGCCIQEEEKMLVYEYMPNKSLDKHLFDQSKRANLDWNLRYHIIEGIAQGILYLHKYSRLRIIHRDLKASNILLDDSMNPKISDFGMARIFGGNQTEANTGRVVGTYGYMSPEYALNGLFPRNLMYLALECY
ncbi:hypothetical protein Scep_028688 [Stephania cephalantha]|uniref:non-specific serine/threonine protein kinase n=1 Tax=Stephania cephalantha TaxID=152367 RepID=A0AAP0EAD9_9MAGN